MKELQIEDKAKRYDVALKAAVVAHKDEDKHLKATLERIFPELKESEDERIRKELITHCKSIRCVTEEGAEGVAKWIDWLEKQGEQKPAWSKEDDKILKSIIINIENLQFSEDMQEKYHHIPNENKSYYQIKIDWLKSLKDRVVPQLKQEWSEEDEDNLNSAIYYIRREPYYEEKVEPIIDWLKSLRPQNHWKPSKEQMLSLTRASNSLVSKEDTIILRKLLNDLEKLRKE